MSYALTANVGGQSPDGVSITTGSIDTTGVTFLVVATATLHDASYTFSDSKSNTWTSLTLRSNSAASVVTVRYVVNPTVGAGHQFQISSATNIFPSIAVQGYTGNAASPFDVENGGTTSLTTSITTGSVTPSLTNSIIIAAATHDGVFATTVNGGFLISNDEHGASSLAFGLTMAYLDQAGGGFGSANPTFTGDGSNENWAAEIVAFKAADGVVPVITGAAASPFFRIRKDSWPGGFYH